MSEVKILGVGGSPRKNGNTDVLLDEFLKGASSAGAEIKKVLLRDYSIESCVGCEACRKSGTCTKFHDGMELLYPEIEECKGIILGSPTYNYNVTSAMKTFIDRMYPYYNFTNDRPRQYSSKLADQGRKAIVFSIAEQAEIKEMGFALEAMQMPLEALGYEEIEKIPVLNCFDRGLISKDKELLHKAFETGKQLANNLL